MSENDGGPVFPAPFVQVLPNGDMTIIRPGMTLRDYFAAALPGLPDKCNFGLMEAMAGEPCPVEEITRLSKLCDHGAVARWAARAEATYRYMRADAMLAERAKGKP